ncbi:MAG: hypothetical protein ACXW1M_07360 [Acidimicrobiia bacterium]
MQETRPTLYASRRIERPMHAVVGDVETFLTRRNWEAVDGTGPSRSRAVNRAFRGVLHRESGRRIARVELEVVAWSDHATEIGLRPIGRRAHRAATRRPYGDAAAALLDGLVRRPARTAAARRRTGPPLRRAS